MIRSCLYLGQVVHHRLRPRRHHLRYRVFSLLLDVDELPRLSQDLRLFSYNKFNLFSFYDKDHGSSDRQPLRSWIERSLSAAGMPADGGSIQVLCYPRILGYVFNPLSVHFCHRQSGELGAILYEVHNTFGERHSYLIPVGSQTSGIVRQICAKRFYVSPFIQVQGTYHFRVVVPDDRLAVSITESDDRGPLLHASFTGERRDLTDSTLIAVFARYPLMTAKVMAGIHWEALRLWRKGIPLVKRPAPPNEPVTVVTPEPSTRGSF